MAELEGLLAGLALVEILNIYPVTFEGDSQIIINLAKKLQQGYQIHRLTKNWRLEFRVERLAETISRVRHCAFSHVRRRANNVADKLANQGVKAKENFAYFQWPIQNETEWGRQVTQAAKEDQQDHERADTSTNQQGLREAITNGSPPPKRTL